MTVLVTDLSGGWTQSMECIRGQHCSCQIAPFQQLRDSTAFVTLAGDFDLAEYTSVAMLNQRDQMAGMPIASDATDGFAIKRQPL